MTEERVSRRVPDDIFFLGGEIVPNAGTKMILVAVPANDSVKGEMEEGGRESNE